LPASGLTTGVCVIATATVRKAGAQDHVRPRIIARPEFAFSVGRG
jgi:hypothetical protein